MSLIPLNRATELVPNFPAADNTVMQDCVNAASDVIVKYCNNNFVLRDYDELYDGTGDAGLLLYQYPIIQIKRISFLPTQVLQIRQTNQTVSRASFRLDGTSDVPPKPNKLYLVRLLNGVEQDININLQTGATTVDGVAGATFPMVTLGDLATAINSFNSFGWFALAMGIYATWPIADLRPPQGAFECKWYGSAYLELHAWQLPVYEQNTDIGEIVCPSGFGWGYRNFRVVYQAGYATIPAAVQQACSALAVSTYLGRGQNYNLTSENLGGYSYSMVAEKTFHQLDIASRYGLSLYKNHRVAKFKV